MAGMLHLPVDPPSLDEMLCQAGLKTGGATRRGSSFWSAYELCPYDACCIEKYGHDYQNSVTPALITGVLVHEGEAHWYQTYDMNEALKPIQIVLAWADKNLTSQFGDFAQVVWQCCKLAERIVRMAISRPVAPQPHNIVTIADPNYEFPSSMIRAVEVPIEYSGDFEYSARIDLVIEVQDENGDQCVAIVDHKTLLRFSQYWVDAFWQDLQFVGLPFLWNEVMVPQGYPPCRYMIANGLVKQPERPSERFVREVYPVRQSRIEQFRTQMIHTWRSFQECQRREQELMARGQPFNYDQVWPRHWAACQSRRYGRPGASWMPKHLSHVIPDGGRCHRFVYCLHEDAYSNVWVPPTTQVQVPQQVQIPAQGMSSPESPPMAVVQSAQQESLTQVPSTVAQPDQQVVGSSRAHGVGSPPGSLPAEAPSSDGEVVDKAIDQEPVGSPYPLTDDRASGITFKHPIPPESSLIVSMERSTPQPYPLHQVPTGECVYIRGTILWVTGVANGNDRMLLEPSCPTLIGYDVNTPAYIVAPTLKQPKVEKLVEEEQSETCKDSAADGAPAAESSVLEVDPRQQDLPSTGAGSTVPVVQNPAPASGETLESALQSASEVNGSNVPQPSTKPRDPTNPVGREVGKTAMAGVGVVPVFYLGSFNKGGQALYPNMSLIWGKRESPFYGAAMTGRDPSKRRLQIIGARGEGDYKQELKGQLGAVTWQHVEEKIVELLAEVQAAVAAAKQGSEG